MSADVAQRVAAAIVQGQVALTGKVAYSMAGRAAGVEVSENGGITISGDPIMAIEGLVKEYSQLTGPLGIRMCYNSAREILESNAELDIPSFRSIRG